MPDSDDPFVWQSRMATLIFSEHDEADLVEPVDWRCSDTLDHEAVLRIYRRNLKGGVMNNLAAQFPVTLAYLGIAGFREVSQALTYQHPPTSPLFKLFAAELPNFILNFEKFDQKLRVVAAALASIDFFSVTVAQPDQVLGIDGRYFELFRSISQARENQQDSYLPQSGLYQLPDLHPETVANAVVADGSLRSSLRGEQLVMVFEARDGSESQNGL